MSAETAIEGVEYDLIVQNGPKKVSEFNFFFFIKYFCATDNAMTLNCINNNNSSFFFFLGKSHESRARVSRVYRPHAGR